LQQTGNTIAGVNAANRGRIAHWRRSGASRCDAGRSCVAARRRWSAALLPGPRRRRSPSGARTRIAGAGDACGRLHRRLARAAPSVNCNSSRRRAASGGDRNRVRGRACARRAPRP